MTPRGCCQRVSGGEYRSRIASATDACDTTDRPRPPLYPLPFPLSRRQIAPRSSRHISLRSALSDSLRLPDFIRPADSFQFSALLPFFGPLPFPPAPSPPPALLLFSLRPKTQGGHKFGWKKSRTFQGHSSTFSRLISSDVLLRCGHIKSNRINFVLLTVVTTQQVMWCTLAPRYA